jgi:dTDP-4-dehydrorhamnose reductase
VRIYLTGARGFVGSNFAHVFAERHGAEVIGPGHGAVNLIDPEAVRRSVAAARPDAVVHTAIWNDPAGLRRDRRRAWAAYVQATRHIVDAANRAEAPIVLISTDWVYDGECGPAHETVPPSPVNIYGFLKAASELVVAERAERGLVARIAGVQGRHRARPDTPRVQDAGFGYLVASVVDALRAGRSFTVWDGLGLNALATPTLATHAGELVWRALELASADAPLPPVLHCCGGEHADRVGLARRAAAAFDLDPERVLTGPAPAAALGTDPIPRDTRLDALATQAALGIALGDLDEMLARLRGELDEGHVEVAT